MRWQTTIESDAVDVVLLRAALPVLLDRLRGLEVSDEQLVHPATHEPISGLRVSRGAHPRPGTQYETIQRWMTPELGVSSPRGGAKSAAFRSGIGGDRPVRESLLELVADDSQQFRLIGAERAGATWAFTIGEPRRAATMAVEGVVSGVGSWITRGEMTGRCSVDLAALEALSEPADADGPVRWSITHRRIRARGRISVDPTPAGWRLDVDATVTLRGVLRPLGVLAGWILRRALDDAAEEMFDTELLIEAMREHPTPNALADHWLGELLAPYVDQP